MNFTYQLFSYCLSLSLIINTSSFKLPSYLRKCKKGSESVKCVYDNSVAAIKALAKEGEPSLKLPKLSPLHVDKIELIITDFLILSLEDLEIYGLETQNVISGYIDENELSIKSHIMQYFLKGQYDVTGKIMILPIQGKGTFNMSLDEYDFDYKATFAIEERNGKKYFKVENNDSMTHMKISNLKNFSIFLDNLFNGDERLSAEMNSFINENWMDIYHEMGGALEQAVAYSFINPFINGYLRHIPVDELFDKDVN